MIKVYFDSKPLNQSHMFRGIGNYTKNLLTKLINSSKIELVDSLINSDVIHYPYFDLFFNTLRIIKGKKNVVTIFDVIPLLYPMNYPSGIRGRINFELQKNALSNVDKIITISETSKKDIVRYLDVPEKKVIPIHLASEAIFTQIKNEDLLKRIANKYSLPKKFVLYVGDVNFNKNLLTLADACVKIKIPLVMVGKHAGDNYVGSNHPENEDFSNFLVKYGNSKNILRPGFVKTIDLACIYNLATVYCQPSIYEGFGLPIIEAQSCGTPVVASRIQSTVEIGCDTCLYINNPKDSSEMADKLQQVIDDSNLVNSLSKLGIENSKRYSWNKTANDTVKTYLCH